MREKTFHGSRHSHVHTGLFDAAGSLVFVLPLINQVQEITESALPKSDVTCLESLTSCLRSFPIIMLCGLCPGRLYKFLRAGLLSHLMIQNVTNFVEYLLCLKIAIGQNLCKEINSGGAFVNRVKS